MLGGNFEKPLEHVHGRFEFLPKAIVFLVSPGIAESHELAVQTGESGLEIGIEPLQVSREPPHFGGIDNRLRHETHSDELRRHVNTNETATELYSNHAIRVE